MEDPAHTEQMKLEAEAAQRKRFLDEQYERERFPEKVKGVIHQPPTRPLARYHLLALCVAAYLYGGVYSAVLYDRSRVPCGWWPL